MAYDIDIFIDTYKDFKPVVNSKCYKVTHGNNIVTDCGGLTIIDCKLDTVLDDKFYSEIYMYKWLSLNYDLKDYVGFNHYRRYWSFFDKLPDVPSIIDKHGAIALRKFTFKGSITAQYASCHNLEDLLIARDIVATKYVEYAITFDQFLVSKTMYPYNMVILRRSDFLSYIDFVWSVLDDYLKIVGTDIKKRIQDNYSKYVKPYTPCNTAEYQFRIGGYLGERLTNVWLMKHFKDIFCFDYVKTEKKYAGEPD